jgi:hypothetical protein
MLVILSLTSFDLFQIKYLNRSNDVSLSDDSLASFLSDRIYLVFDLDEPATFSFDQQKSF